MKNKTAPKSTTRNAAPRKAAQKVSVAPVSKQRRVTTGAPQIHYQGGSDGRCVVRHREYVQDISGSVGFSCSTLAVNPGIAATFPWLSQIAPNYESYIFKKCNFEFETQKSTASSGSLMMAIDYDAADSAPSDKTTLMSYMGAVRSAVWDECRFAGDRADLRKFGQQRYNRSAALASNLDIKTYDVGNLQIATQGCADTSAIGELYVDYEVEFHTPQKSSAPAATAAQWLRGASGTAGTSWLGTTPVSTGAALFTATASTLTCVVPGSYMVTVKLASSSGNITYDQTMSGSSATIDATNTNGDSLVSTNVSTLVMFESNVTATAGQTIVLTGSTGGTWSSSQVLIVPVGNWSSL